MRNTILVLLLLGLSLAANSQRGWEVGGWLGASYYFGDLNTNYNLSKPGIAFGFSSRFNFNTRVSAEAGIDYARVSASDEKSNNSYQRTRNLDFRTGILDFNFNLEFNFFPYIHGSDDNYYTPYLFGGFAIMSYNPKTDVNGNTVVLRDLGTEGQSFGNEYGLMSGAFTYGFGMKWDLNKDLSLNVHLSGRKIFSDYIDDVSTTYPSMSVLMATRGPEAVAASNKSLDPNFARPNLQRGNGRNNDVVYYMGVSLMKYFGKLRCPAISNPQY